MAHVASIVHLTDLHLFVHADGALRSPADRRLVERLAVAALGHWSHGLATADGTALGELVDFLPHVVKAERVQGATVIVAQTGDVEAFGYVDPDGLGGYAFLHNELWPLLEEFGATCVDVYGNHDLWPGFPPVLRGAMHDARHLLTLPAFANDWTTPISVPTPHGIDLRVHRANTVLANVIVGGVLARGGVGPHPPDKPFSVGNISCVVERLRGGADDCASPTLNVLLCHHPPHLFNSSWGTALTTGYLKGAEDLCAATPRPIALVLSGHRHQLDPATPIDVADGRQPPLAAGAGQLVAASPTQRDGNPNSFAVYRLHYDTQNSTVDVERLLFAFRPSTGLTRVPDSEPAILRGIRVHQPG